MKLKEFKNTGVQCKTKDEFNRLMQIYEDAGWHWRAGQNPTEFDCWDDEEERTCLDIHNDFRTDSISRWESHGYSVLSFTEFLRKQGISGELKIGDWVEVTKSFDEPHSRCLKGVHHFRCGEKYQVVDDEGYGFAVQTPASPIDMSKSKRENFRKCSPTGEGRLTTSTAGLLLKHTVYKHPDADIQLWVRNGEVEIRKSGRKLKGKTFTIVGDAAQWVEIFFQGYTAAQ
jgi:hypothetical protein